MKRIAPLLLALAIMTGILRAQAGASDPAAVTKAAYQTAMAHFGFTPDTVRHEKPYLTPELYAALLKKANQPVAQGDAPDIEGDVLLNAQDPPDKFEVSRYSSAGNAGGGKANVPVTLFWGKEQRRYIVRLTQINRAWKITDVDYGGKDGKLSDLLK